MDGLFFKPVRINFTYFQNKILDVIGINDRDHLTEKISGPVIADYHISYKLLFINLVINLILFSPTSTYSLNKLANANCFKTLKCNPL